MPTDVLLDTSMLLAQYSVSNLMVKIGDILQRKVNFVITPSILGELRGLSKERSKAGRAARLALDLAKGLTVVDAKKGGAVDAQIVELAKAKKLVVATADIRLKRRLRRLNLPVLYVRSDRKLDFDGVDPDYC